MVLAKDAVGSTEGEAEKSGVKNGQEEGGDV